MSYGTDRELFAEILNSLDSIDSSLSTLVVIAQKKAEKVDLGAVAVPTLRCVLCRQPGGVLVEGRDGIRWHEECARDV